MNNVRIVERGDIDRRAEAVIGLMASGGDARIVLNPETGLNRYWSAPRPAATLAYASSTANDISAPAFDHVLRRFDALGPALSGAGYAAALERLRERIRAAYALAGDVDIVFAASGTDLEYVALLTASRGDRAVYNILLGADEVGSGCIHSARGCYFASETPLCAGVRAGDPVPGLARELSLVDLPVRDPDGGAHGSAAMTAAIDGAVAEAHRLGRHPLVHVVHGSKTGLVLPELADIDGLIARHGNGLSLVVDACQARIAPPRVNDYLRRGGTVFLTGSKFMGGPPFSGIALIPPGARAPLSAGFATLARRAEWPAGWSGSERLRDEANPGLLLRLEASVFELERFRRLPQRRVDRVVVAFSDAVDDLAWRIGARRVAAARCGPAIESATLATLDLSGTPGNPDFDEARRRHAALIADGIRLGQPVKCVRLADGRWGATLRVALSMPQIVDLDTLGDRALSDKLGGDMAAIARALTEPRALRAA